MRSKVLLGAIAANVGQVDNVLSVKVLENPVNVQNVVQGVTMPPYSIYVGVVGGAGADIAEVLAKTKTLGCPMVGNTVVSYFDPIAQYNNNYQINRPTITPIDVEITYAANSTTPANVQTVLADTLLAYLAENMPSVGQTVSSFFLNQAFTNFGYAQVYSVKVKLSTDVTFGDYEYASARLRQFLDAQLENGDIPALTFGSRHASQVHQLFFLPVWIYYNYRFTANITRLRETIPSLDLTLEYFEAMIDENTGLLVDTETRFSFDSRISSGEFRAGEIPTYINALFCRFLLSAAEIYRTVEEEEKAAHCYDLAGKVAEELRNRNFDPACSLFCRWSLESERMPDHNLFANFCAMFGGVLPLSSFEYFFYSFFNYDPPFDRSDESRHPYFHFLFMEMMFALGQKEWPFRYFRDYWSKRMCPEANAWRVDFDHADPAPTKFSEGSCVSPNIFLVREILGIRIAEAGHSVIYFNPAFHQVDWAESVFPMARGRLKVKWAVQEDGSLDVTLDSSFPVKILPEMSHKQLANTVFRLGEKVTLLNPTPDYDIDDDEGDDSRE